MVEDVIGITQLAIGIMTLFITFFSVSVAIMAIANYRAANLPKKELKQLRVEMAAVRKELEELREFKKELSQHTLLSV